MSTEPDSAVEQLRRELAATQRQVRGLRLAFVRVACLPAVGLVVAGLVVPAWRDEQSTVRVGTAGFALLGDGSALSGDDAAFGVAFVVGFLGLLAVSVVAVGVLVLLWYGDARLRGRRWCLLVGALAITGSAVAGLFSLIALGSDEPGVDGGWGAVLLLAGAIVYQAVTSSSVARELCFRPDLPDVR